MFTVGVSDMRCSACDQLMSRTQCCTPMIFFAASSLKRFAAVSIIAFSSAAVSGRTFFVRPSIAGSFPSAETSVFNACTKCQTGLSTRALFEE